MSNNITFTVKNHSELMNFVGKFTKVSNSVLITLHNDRLVARGSFQSTELNKVSTLKYSDVFEESEINIEAPYFLGLHDKLDKLKILLSMFKEDYKITFQIDQLDKGSNTAYINDIWDNGKENIDVVNRIFIKNSKLRVTTSTSMLSAVTKLFKVDDELIRRLISLEVDGNVGYGKFELSSEALVDLNSLLGKSKLINVAEETKQNIGIRNTKDNDNIIISIDGYFDYKVPMISCVKSIDECINIPTIAALDIENYDVEVIQNSQVIGLVFRSQATDSITFIACAISPKGIKG